MRTSHNSLICFPRFAALVVAKCKARLTAVAQLLPTRCLSLLLTVMCVIGCLPSSVYAVSIYVDYYKGSTEGDGVPSSAFAAAAGVPGLWNGLSFSETNAALVDISSSPTGVTVSNSAGGTSGTNGSPPAGDTSLLLNDALDGSNIAVTLTGLPTGQYNVYTYSWYPANATTVLSTVTVNGLDPQNVGRTGIFAGFVLGETHTLHTVSISSPQTLTINVAIANLSAILNGFQIVMIPEPSSLALLFVGAGSLFVWRRFRRK